MKVLKGLLISFLGFLLGLCLAISGLVYTIQATALNPDFLRIEINELDVSSVMLEVLGQNSSVPQDNGGITEQQVMTAISDTVTQIEPVLKERVTTATSQIYDYLLGKKPNPDVAGTLRGTVLKADFLSAVIDKIDFTAVIQQVLNQQLSQAPPEFQKYMGAAIDKVVTDIKPQIQKQIEAAAEPMLDYLVGRTDNFSVTLNVEQLKGSLKTALHEAVFVSPPPELQNIPPAQREIVFNQLFDNLASGIDSSIQLDQSILGTEARTGLKEGIREAENGLTQARQYVAIFQLGCIVLIALIVILAAAISLVYREVRGATRYLSIVLLTYGVLELAGALLARYFAGRELPALMVDIPVSLQTWLLNLVSRLLSPTITYSVVLLAAGIILLIISFLYPKPAESV